MAHINYTSGDRVVNELPYTVYTRATWTDSWTAQPNMSCNECLWTAAPQINSAHLRWDIGNIIMPGDSTPSVLGPWTGRGQFVRIDWQCDDTTLLRWVGYIDTSSKPLESWGTQEIVAYGLERALALTPIDRVVYRDQVSEEAVQSQTVLPFNGPHGRRAATAVDDVYVFADVRDTDSAKWSTRQIVEYLLTHHLPTSTGGVDDLTWEIDQLTQLPDWDSPIVETAGRTVWDVLTELITPERMLGLTVASDGTDVFIRFFTHATTTLTVNGNSITANPRQHTVTLAPDALTDAHFQDVGGGYDQVICRGARRKSICTLRAFELESVDPQLIPMWEESDADDYNAGASAVSGYDSLTDEEKQLSNDTYRAAWRLHNVYRRLQLDPEWDYTFGLDEELDPIEVFPDNDAPSFVRMLPYLPIRPNTQWDGEVSEDFYDRDGDGIAPLLTWLGGGGDPFSLVMNHALGQLSAVLDNLTRSFTVDPRIAGDQDRELLLDVVGGPQHLIAKTDFDALPVDTVLAQLEWSGVSLTVALEEDRHCQAIYPTSISGSANVVRRILFDMGDDYQHIYIVPGTVASVSGLASDEITSDGGTLVDDTEVLESIAEFIATSLLLTRQTVTWNSSRKTSVIAVGDLITTAQGSNVYAPITAIHMRGGVSVNRPAAAIVQSFECFRGTIDPLRILQDLGAG